MAATVAKSKLLASAFSAMLGVTVITYEQYQREKYQFGEHCFQKLTIEQLFRVSNLWGRVGDLPSAEGGVDQIFVKTFEGRTITIEVSSLDSVRTVKCKIEDKEGVPVGQQGLIFNRKVLEDDRLLRDYDIRQGATLYLGITLRGGGGDFLKYYLDDSLLDPGYDYDFTNKTDDGTPIYRGGRRYYRPYGWKRYALKVLGRYEDDTWLGEAGYRSESSAGEWPVSYHGTALSNAHSIAQDGYDLTRGKVFAYEKGIYSSPSAALATCYAQKFVHEGEEYRLMFQNRVSTDGLFSHLINCTGGEYWVQPNDRLIRPYGICIKRL